MNQKGEDPLSPYHNLPLFSRGFLAMWEKGDFVLKPWMQRRTLWSHFASRCSSLRIAWDGTDYADYTSESVSANISHSHKPPPPADASLQPSSAPEKLFSHSEDMQDAQDYRDVADISVINRNHRNQSELQCLEETQQVERSEGDIALDPNDASPGKARASPVAPGKKRCPHHPHARWIRFDPSGQAWCDRMDCWDCYRLMKIGEALDYRPLSEYTRGIVALEQGIEAWSSFVTSQGSFAVLTATEQAIAFCKVLGVEVLDLSGEVQRLVSAWE